MSDDDPGPTGPVVYRESPRGFRETLLVSVVFFVGFAIDLSFDVGGAVTHLPGWLIAAAIVIGIDAILVAAARSTHTLTVTPEQVWIGDEMISREAVTGTSDVELGQLPVLGWPTGKPGRLKGVALRLDDGRDVLVPSRAPARLAEILAAAPVASEPVAIRPATEDDLAALPEIDRRAEIVFGLSGIRLPAIEWDLPDEYVAVLVAGDPAVGFALLTEVDGLAHLEEIAVLPGVMRTGLGTRLLEQACDSARAAGYAAMTLCTFRDVAWNGLWYAARGFTELSTLTPGLAQLRAKESEIGLDAAGPRIAMRRELRS